MANKRWTNLFWPLSPFSLLVSCLAMEFEPAYHAIAEPGQNETRGTI